MIKAIRGMHDLLPEDDDLWQWIEAAARRIFAAYGYGGIRPPLIESTALFTQAIGEATDVVEKEMYTFADRRDHLLSLRPEGTAGVVRAVIEHGLLQQLPLRLWYCGPMFRYERPQLGRTRQFHQIGAEVFGAAGVDSERELLLICHRLWQALGVAGKIRLLLNNLGDDEERRRYREALHGWLVAHRERLDPDSRRRVDRNPLRVLDSKVAETRELLAAAPRLEAFLGRASRDHLATLGAALDEAGIAWQYEPGLVRGLDYYNRTVFEWVTDELGAQGTVCGGGRYDGLCARHGGPDVPGVGFALGLERLAGLVGRAADARWRTAPEVYLVMAGEAAEQAGWRLAEALRDALPGLRLQMNLGGGSFKAQFKRADRSGARWALILGADEVRDGTIGLKDLRGDQRQATLRRDQVVQALAERVTATGGNEIPAV